MTPICPLCGSPMFLRLVGQRECSRCRREGRRAPEPFVPEWRKRLTAKDMTNYRGGAA